MFSKVLSLCFEKMIRLRISSLFFYLISCYDLLPFILSPMFERRYCWTGTTHNNQHHYIVIFLILLDVLLSVLQTVLKTLFFASTEILSIQPALLPVSLRDCHKFGFYRELSSHSVPSQPLSLSPSGSMKRDFWGSFLIPVLWKSNRKGAGKDASGDWSRWCPVMS